MQQTPRKAAKQKLQILIANPNSLTPSYSLFQPGRESKTSFIWVFWICLACQIFSASSSCSKSETIFVTASTLFYTVELFSALIRCTISSFAATVFSFALTQLSCELTSFIKAMIGAIVVIVPVISASAAGFHPTLFWFIRSWTDHPSSSEDEWHQRDQALA